MPELKKEVPPLSTVFRALFGDAPYFGGTTFGFQGNFRRHVFMACAAQLGQRPGTPLRILEIGSWMGSSALTWAQTMRQTAPLGGKITCVDLWAPFTVEDDLAKGGVYADFNALAKTEIPYELFLHNTRSITGWVEREVHRGRSRDVLPKLPRGHYDVVYVDASHYYEDVLADLKMAESLVRTGGILCGDDLELQIGDVDEAFARAKIKEDYVRDPRTGEGFHPGVTLACHEFFGRKVPNSMGFFYVQKTATSYADPSLIGASIVIPSHFTPEMQAACRAMLGV